MTYSKPRQGNIGPRVEDQRHGCWHRPASSSHVADQDASVRGVGARPGERGCRLGRQLVAVAERFSRSPCIAGEEVAVVECRIVGVELKKEW